MYIMFIVTKLILTHQSFCTVHLTKFIIIIGMFSIDYTIVFIPPQKKILSYGTPNEESPLIDLLNLIFFHVKNNHHLS